LGNKKNKELAARLAEAEEEADAERQGKMKADKQRAELARELDELSARLEEAGGASQAQMESQMRKKHQNAVSEMAEQLEQVARIKSK